MTEEEYAFIRKLESNYFDVLSRMSNIENMTNPNDIKMLHEDLTKVTDNLHEIIEKRVVKSVEALKVIEKLKMGFIEMLATTDELLS